MGRDRLRAVPAFCRLGVLVVARDSGTRIFKTWKGS
jgi:hypothetical protein